MAEKLQESIIVAMHTALNEFGYRVDLPYIREQANRLANPEEKPRGGPELFMETWLKDAGIR